MNVPENLSRGGLLGALRIRYPNLMIAMLLRPVGRKKDVGLALIASCPT